MREANNRKYHFDTLVPFTDSILPFTQLIRERKMMNENLQNGKWNTRSVRP
jgi:hypothetical protein